MKRTWKLLSITVVMVMFFSSCVNDYDEVMIYDPNELHPVQVGYNTLVTYTAGGKKTATLFCPVIQHFQADSEYFVLKEGFIATFFDSLGNEESGISADYGVWQKQSHKMEGEKNVKAYNTALDTLFTEYLVWYQDSGLISTPDSVHIKKIDADIYGVGLEAKADFSAYTIHTISGIIMVPENETDSIQ